MVLVVVVLCALPSSLLKKILAVLSLVVCALGYLLNWEPLTLGAVRGKWMCSEWGVSGDDKYVSNEMLGILHFFMVYVRSQVSLSCAFKMGVR